MFYQCNVCGYVSWPADKISKAIIGVHSKEHDEEDKRRTDRDNQKSPREASA